jgi:hypothetical protein
MTSIRDMWLADRVSFARTALCVSAPIIIWAAHFGVIYGFTGLACARRFTDGGATWLALVPWVIGLATAAAVAAALVFFAPIVRKPAGIAFIDWMSGWTAALAILAMLLEAITVLWVPVCG